MNTFVQAYAIILLMIGVGAALFSHSVQQRYAGTGRRAVRILLVCSALWTISYSLELLSSSMLWKTIWVFLQFASTVGIPGAWIGFTIYFTIGSAWFNRRRVATLFAVPALMLALVFTNQFHHLVWEVYYIDISGPVAYPVMRYGPAMHAFLFYAFVLVLFGAYLIIRQMRRTGPTYRLQGIAMLLGVTLPVLVSFLEQTRLLSVNHLELAPPVVTVILTDLFWKLDTVRWWDILAISGPQVVRSMQDGVIVLDPQMRLVSMNPAAERIIGCDEKSMVRKPLDRFFAGWPILAPDGSRPRAHEIHAEVSRAGLTYDLKLSSIVDGRGLPVSLVVVLRDITRRVQAETALRQSEERIHLFFENVNDMVYLVDANFQIVNITPSVEKLLGYRPDELIGHRLDAGNVLPPEFIAAAMEDMRRVFAGEHIASALYEFIGKDGRRRWMDVSGAPSLLDTPNPIVICVARDVSERIRAQEQTQASLREKEALLKEIHHRVKNNLQVISSLLNLQAAKIGDPATRELFLESQNRVRSMALVHQKLYGAEDLAHISFVDYLHSLVDSLSRMFHSPGQKIRIEIQAEDFYLDIDQAIPCGLIINELVTNSFKHAFRGRSEGRISIDMHPNGQGEMILSVGDDGMGYPVGLDIFSSPSLGLNLVTGLSAQIGARLELAPGPGAGVRLHFPVN